MKIEKVIVKKDFLPWKWYYIEILLLQMVRYLKFASKMEKNVNFLSKKSILTGPGPMYIFHSDMGVRPDPREPG